VNKKSALYGLLSLILVFLVIEGSTGITTVFHHCSSHGESSVISGLLPSAETKDDCCRHTEQDIQISSDCCEHNESENRNNNESTLNDHCCDYEFSTLKITNYLPSLKFEIITPALLNSFFVDNIGIEGREIPAYNEFILSKPGGRDIIKSICILLT